MENILGLRFKSEYKISAIILLAFILRIINLNQSFWLDEAIGAYVVQNRGFWDIATLFPTGDNHPPLYYVFLKLTMLLLGETEVALRSISVIAGCLTVYLTYKISKLLKLKYPLLAPLLLSTSQLHIYYSQEARMYIFAGLFVTAGFYNLIKAVHEDKLLNWAVFSVMVFAIGFTDYFPMLVYPAYFIYALFSTKDKLRVLKKLVFSITPFAAFFFIWMPVFIKQIEGGRWLLESLPKWAELAGGTNLRQILLLWAKFVFGRISLHNKVLYALIIFVSSIPYLFPILKKIDKKNFIFWIWITLPVFLGVLISFVIPAFSYFRLIFILPAFYLLVSCNVEKLKPRVQFATVALLILINFSSLAIYYTDKAQQREMWRHALYYLEEVSGENDILLFANKEPFAPVLWYFGRERAFGATDSILATVETKKRVSEIIESGGYQGIYYFDYLKTLHDPSDFVVQAMVENDFLPEAEIGIFEGIGKITYYRKI
jgi:uncharacterized membrane protein